MPALYGYKVTWEEFPDWPGRYDFAVKRSPYAEKAPASVHVERAARGPLSQVVAYQGSLVAEAPSGLRRLWARPARAALFFTRVFWKDERGRDHALDRAELCAAFRRLVGAWQDVFALAHAVHRAWDLAPFTADGAPREPGTAAALELEARFFARLWAAGKEALHAGLRLFWEAEFVGQLLAHLSDAEDGARLPRPFARFPGPINADVSARFKYRLQLHKGPDGQLDDHALRTARAALTRPESALVRPLREELQALLVEILDAKGYDGPVEAAAHYYPRPAPGVPCAEPSRESVKVWELYQLLTPVVDPRRYDSWERDDWWDADHAYLPRPAWKSTQSLKMAEVKPDFDRHFAVGKTYAQRPVSQASDVSQLAGPSSSTLGDSRSDLCPPPYCSEEGEGARWIQPEAKSSPITARLH